MRIMHDQFDIQLRTPGPVRASSTMSPDGIKLGELANPKYRLYKSSIKWIEITSLKMSRAFQRI